MTTDTHSFDARILDVGTVTLTGGSLTTDYEISGTLWDDAEFIFDIAFGWFDFEGSSPGVLLGHKGGCEWEPEESRYTFRGEFKWAEDPGEGTEAEIGYVIYYGENVRVLV